MFGLALLFVYVFICPFMGVAAILVVTWTIYINFRSPFPRRLHIKFGFDWPSGFSGEDV